MQRREETDIHRSVNPMPQFIHVLLAKIHVNKTTIDLSNPVLKTSNNAKFFLSTENNVRADLYFDQMPDIVEVEKAVKGSGYDGTRTRKPCLEGASKLKR
jgi:hypothetical protein